jgi:hypothetical protein
VGPVVLGDGHAADRVGGHGGQLAEGAILQPQHPVGDLLQAAGDLAADGGVEVGGGLLGRNDHGIVGQHAGDRHLLVLPTRELLGLEALPVQSATMVAAGTTFKAIGSVIDTRAPAQPELVLRLRLQHHEDPGRGRRLSAAIGLLLNPIIAATAMALSPLSVAGERQPAWRAQKPRSYRRGRDR